MYCFFHTELYKAALQSFRKEIKNQRNGSNIEWFVCQPGVSRGRKKSSYSLTCGNVAAETQEMKARRRVKALSCNASDSLDIGGKTAICLAHV